MKNQRHKTLIYPAFQWRWGFLLAWTAVSGFLLGLFLLVFIPYVMRTFSQHLSLSPMTISEAFKESWPGLAIGAAILFGMAIVWGIQFSHRTAGPLYRLEWMLSARLSDHPLKPIRLRRHDELAELTKRLNELLDKMDAEEKKKIPIPTPTPTPTHNSPSA